KALEMGADLLQGKTPLQNLNAYLDGFHFYNGNMKVQMEAHHYCGYVNEDVIQCAIFDGNARDAKLMGVEYIISKPLFVQLPAAEKHLWHSHVHEVRSGQLIAPGIPAAAEHELMEKVAGTYGKTWHTWDTSQQSQLPLGIPMLMMGFTQDGQASEPMVNQRDKRFDVSSSDNRKQRADIDYPAIDAGADAWEDGVVIQLQAIDQSDQPATTPGRGHSPLHSRPDR
ncbi:MAG: OBAP family protein, partial [Steroidobacteraceae bacterium]